MHGKDEHIKNISNIIRDYNTEDTFVSDFPFEHINNVDYMIKTYLLCINSEKTGE